MKMSDIQKYFKSKNITAIEKSFLKQCEKNTESSDLDDNKDDVWAKEKIAYENKITALEHEKKSISLKYENLKTKHVQLLQLLMQLEKKNQTLESRQVTETTPIPIPKLDYVQLQVSNSAQCALHIYFFSKFKVYHTIKINQFLQCDVGKDSLEQLTDDDLKKLDAISTSARNDATFIRILMEILYKDNICTLMYRSFSGQKRKAKKNTTPDLSLQENSSSEPSSTKAISPQKKDIIFALFKQRIEKTDIPMEEKLNRMKTEHIKRLVAVAIDNHRTKIEADTMK